MPLTNCIECHRQISDSATKCPGCSTHEPFGVVCELCGERLRRSQGVTSVRREFEVHLSRESSSWYGTGEVDREIVAHKDCLERYYTPPETLSCSECGLRLASSDLGLTALNLWSAGRFTYEGLHGSRVMGVHIPNDSCPNCGKHNGLLHSVQCEWELKSFLYSSTVSKAKAIKRLPPLPVESGMHYPCMRPLYSFQVGPTGQGHGHEKDKRARAEAEKKKQEEQAAFHNKLKRQNLGEWVYLGIVNGGLLGIVVGFFRSCSIQHFSFDGGTMFVTIVVFAVIGAVIGGGIGYALES